MRHLIMGTAGHVDHGKTALIKALTNIDCDTHKEEKLRGITINLGFSYLNLSSGESIGIIDVPGHKDFINTMVSGACGIDFVLLVIAADSGIMPQTIEHVNIITALGIKNGIIALTKVDLVDEELAEMAKFEIMEFLNNTPLKNIPIIGVSSTSGQGLSELTNSIEKIIPQIAERKKGETFRLFIDRTFTVKGIGNVVTGTVLNGDLNIGQEVFLLPGDTKHKVKSIERHGHSVNSVTAGDRAAIQLMGIKKEDIKKGSLISDKLLESTKMVDACITLFDNNFKLQNWSVITFHSGTFESQARMHKINEDGKNIIVQFHFDKSATLLTNDKFIIRNSSGDKTIGGGYIIDAFPLHHKKRTTKLVESLSSLSKSILNENNLTDLICIELKKDIRPFTIKQIADKLNLKPEDILIQIKNQPQQVSIINENILIYIEYENIFKNKIINLLRDFLKENTLSNTGLTSIEILGKLNLLNITCGKEYLEKLMIKMDREQLIENKNNSWVLKGYNQSIDSKTAEEINWLENEFLNYDIQKPALSEIEERAFSKKITKDKIKKYLHYLTGQNKLILFKNDYVHFEIAKKYKSFLLNELKTNENGIEISEFRQKTGVSKRLAPILIALYESQKTITTQNSGIKVQIFLKK
jgi:selenocysteine-specific elongation factor